MLENSSTGSSDQHIKLMHLLYNFLKRFLDLRSERSANTVVPPAKISYKLNSRFFSRGLLIDTSVLHVILHEVVCKLSAMLKDKERRGELKRQQCFVQKFAFLLVQIALGLCLKCNGFV